MHEWWCRIPDWSIKSPANTLMKFFTPHQKREQINTYKCTWSFLIISACCAGAILKFYSEHIKEVFQGSFTNLILIVSVWEYKCTIVCTRQDHMDLQWQKTYIPFFVKGNIIRKTTALSLTCYRILPFPRIKSICSTFMYSNS